MFEILKNTLQSNDTIDALSGQPPTQIRHQFSEQPLITIIATVNSRQNGDVPTTHDQSAPMTWTINPWPGTLNFVK